VPGARRFQTRPLGDLVNKGSISTGQLALLAKHVFLTPGTQLTYQGEVEHEGRRAYEYSYDVPASASHYHLRMAKADEVTAFQGEFWIDAETLDVLRLEVQAYDIPESLGLAQADTMLDYLRMDVDGRGILLPSTATLQVVATSGDENMNRARFSSCRHYETESTIRFAADLAPARSGEAERTIVKPTQIPGGTVLELNLDSGLDPATAKLGDAIKATLAREVRTADGLVLPPGAAVSGRLVRLERTTMPYPIYEVGFEFDSLALGNQVIPVSMTMDEAGPAAGLIQQSKHMDPKFSRKRTNYIDMLVREVQKGQGILDWDAKRAPIPRGLRMKWRVLE